MQLKTKFFFTPLWPLFLIPVFDLRVNHLSSGSSLSIPEHSALNLSQVVINWSQCKNPETCKYFPPVYLFSHLQLTAPSKDAPHSFDNEIIEKLIYKQILLLWVKKFRSFEDRKTGEGMYTKIMHSSSQQSNVDFPAILSRPIALALVVASGIVGKEEEVRSKEKQLFFKKFNN